jgi:hypothetical protein
MKQKIQPDKQKAKSLIQMAEITLERLKGTDNYKYPTNTLTDYYDSIHKLMESLGFIEGIKIKGDGAHQELIDHICKKYNLSESIRIFLQEMRDFRNRISYEGFMINENYIRANSKKIEDIIKILKSLVNI